MRIVDFECAKCYHMHKKRQRRQNKVVSWAQRSASVLETARSFCLRADGIGRSLRTGNDRIASFDQKVNKKKGRGLYRNQGIFHVPGLHPAALTQLQGAGVCLQGQRCCPPRRRAGSAAAVHPGALRKAGIHYQRLPHRCPQRCRGRQQVEPAPSGPGGGLLR